MSLIRRPIRRWAPVFILPTFLAFCIGFVWPFVQGIYLSFCSFNTPKDARLTGINNYLKVFADEGFRTAFKNTAAFAVVSVVVINVAAFFIAYLNKGCSLMSTYCSVPSEMIDIIQAAIFLFFAAEQFLSGYRQKLVVKNTRADLMKAAEGRKA